MKQEEIRMRKRDFLTYRWSRRQTRCKLGWGSRKGNSARSSAVCSCRISLGLSSPVGLVWDCRHRYPSDLAGLIHEHLVETGINCTVDPVIFRPRKEKQFQSPKSRPPNIIAEVMPKDFLPSKISLILHYEPPPQLWKRANKLYNSVSQEVLITCLLWRNARCRNGRPTKHVFETYVQQAPWWVQCRRDYSWHGRKCNSGWESLHSPRWQGATRQPTRRSIAIRVCLQYHRGVSFKAKLRFPQKNV